MSSTLVLVLVASWAMVGIIPAAKKWKAVHSSASVDQFRNQLLALERQCLIKTFNLSISFSRAQYIEQSSSRPYAPRYVGQESQKCFSRRRRTLLSLTALIAVSSASLPFVTTVALVSLVLSSVLLSAYVYLLRSTIRRRNQLAKRAVTSRGGSYSSVGSPLRVQSERRSLSA